MARTWVFLLAVLCVRSVQCTNSTMDITTKAGTFTGSVEEVHVQDQVVRVTSFLGIPYAAAPVGELRFENSVLKPPLNETYNATYHRSMCPQEMDTFVPKKFDTSEDCLFLNIYVKSDSKRDMPVMVWLHGGFPIGLYKHGGSNYYSGEVLAAHADVVVVTINYRLSVLGFFSTGDDRLPGNYGLWDQHTALKWVNENIASFKGDPSRVTLFGQQTGAVSALYQGMYPGNKGILHRIIAQSGSPISIGKEYIGPFVKRPDEQSGLFSFGCLTVDDPKECMRNKPLNNKTMLQTSGFLGSFPTTPVYDGEFLRADPKVMLNPENDEYKDVQDFFKSLSLLIGYNDMDGLSFMNLLLLSDPVHGRIDPNTFEVTYTQFEKAVSASLEEHMFVGSSKYTTKNISEGLRDRVMNRYSDLNDPYDEYNIRDMLLQFVTDYVFRVPVLRTMQTYKALGGSQGYVYTFYPQPGFKFRKFQTPTWAKQANNGDEIPFIFGVSRKLLNAFNVSDSYAPSSAEMELSRRMMGYWGSFARSGSPEDKSFPGFHWPEFSSTSGAFSKLTLEAANHSITGEHFGQSSASFWDSLSPYFETKDVDSDDAVVELDKDIEDCKGGHTGLPVNTLETILFILGPTVIFALITLAIACMCCCRVKRKRGGVTYETIEMRGKY